MFKVRHHKGRSGLSVFEWRVYHVIQHHARIVNIQLGKYRTQEAAERAAEHYRKNAERIALNNAS